MSVHVFFHPGLSESEGSGSQLLYILPQHCLQRNRQTQVAVLWRHYDETGKETEKCFWMERIHRAESIATIGSVVRKSMFKTMIIQRKTRNKERD